MSKRASEGQVRREGRREKERGRDGETEGRREGCRGKQEVRSWRGRGGMREAGGM